MRKALAVAGAAALALGLGATAGAQPPGTEGPGGPRGPRMGRADGMARFLGLSEDQKAQVQRLMEGQRAQHEALWEKVQKNHQQLEQALESGNPEPAAVGELAIEGHRLRQEGRALREAQDKAIRTLLTPDQQSKFDAMKALREGGMGGWGRMGMGPMGHPPMPPDGGDDPRP